MVIFDARRDERFAANPLVTDDKGIRFYAGVPITTGRGVRFGAFCIIDDKPRCDFEGYELKLLCGLARLAFTHVQMRPGRPPAKAVGSFAEATALAIVTVDALGKITFWNSAATGTFGHSRNTVIGADLTIIIPDRSRKAHKHGFNRSTESGSLDLAGKPVEVTAVHADGHEIPIELSIACWDTDDGPPFGAHIQDITPRKRRENELQILAKTVPLSGLMNAKAFRDCLDVHLRKSGTATLLVMQLDRFESVNDSLGHAIGDALLQTLTLYLRKLSGDTSCIASLGPVDIVGQPELCGGEA